MPFDYGRSFQLKGATTGRFGITIRRELQSFAHTRGSRGSAEARWGNDQSDNLIFWLSHVRRAEGDACVSATGKARVGKIIIWRAMCVD
jgi:hypothetical protein